MKKIELKGIFKSYLDNQILNDINFSVKSGEAFVIVGPSGSGKSTILNLIAGLVKPDFGEVFMGGREITHENSKNRNVSFVFQDFALYPHMTVYNNIAFALKSKRMNKTDIRARVESISHKLQIEKLSNRYPNELSGGQKQRVALARALATEAEIILMDEPLSSLDTDLRFKLHEELKEFHKENNTTLIFVTHDQTEAMTIADRIMIINNGIIEQIGTPREIYLEPKTPFVGRFFGTPKMNLFKDETGKLFGVRPQHIKISDIDSGEPVVIKSIDYLGKENWIHFEYDAHPFILLTTRMDLEVGQTIHIILEESKIAIF
ncbi:ABC transporter ATP-binding protein [Phocicoccus pinnipedialis]|uniref:sn-glycerol-3-phosphate import ATP-binding protein UgpC n=1 Tax=Phocicoccus pinnipedialis TaxID=110845 RepID=A0A6V7R9Y8_9BACL|nr:ABC transporter ATP-binding protein [Jeotgalicoccus pinnipedialis]MBP1940159.1 ABC-type sugar transport system ATPase subunit [Jeotgalicoccus pinnipedialis]CAD2073788.1 sn-glycerol-3-phosphate import ATP-binding protein UgpC [Jeotgalicoccus pinnipedialis]